MGNTLKTFLEKASNYGTEWWQRQLDEIHQNTRKEHEQHLLWLEDRLRNPPNDNYMKTYRDEKAKVIRNYRNLLRGKSKEPHIKLDYKPTRVRELKPA